VSSETAKLIQQQVIENYNGEYKTAIEKWAKNPEQHDYYVVVDSFDNRDLVANEVNNTNVKVARDYICGMDPDMLQIAKLLSMGSIVLLIITTVLTLLIITPITLISVLNRKSEIGLMKAIGYKSRQIFLILYLEQLIKTIRGFIIGGAISSVIIVLINYIINNNSFIDYYMGSFFLVGLEQHLISLGFSLAFAIIVPLICQLITVHKLSKIQPREAMS
jgi:ABC-type antimicrobial peptide transport system permease subunit